MQRMVFTMNLCRLAANMIRVELHPDDEQLIYSKHVEDRLFELFKKENYILVVFIKQIYITMHGLENVKFFIKYFCFPLLVIFHR